MLGAVPATNHVMEVETTLSRRTRPTAALPADTERFEILFRTHYGAIHAYARRRLPERADDIVADTFFVAWRRLDDVPRDALPWLYGVARRVAAEARAARHAGRRL